MLLSLRKNGLTSLFKEVRVFKGNTCVCVCFFFLGEKDRKTVQILKNYGGSKILRPRAPYYF